MAKIGNYIIGRQIGEGGFGRVFQAEHYLLGEKACVKQNINASEEDVEFLRREAKLLWKLYEHHSIPNIKDFMQLDKENAVLITNYIDGKTLEDAVSEKGPLYPEDASWITERLLGALYYVHFNGVVHGDVKPQNVFVEPQKHDIKLIDFGLSTYKPTGKTKPAGYSPKYAAPEIIANQPPIPESDLYGVGIVMIRALGGDISKKSFRSDTPEELANFCSSLLLYDPRERPKWDSGLVEKISDIREKVFGRRHFGLTKAGVAK
jgi:serine/threonine-protein kinase